LSKQLDGEGFLVYYVNITKKQTKQTKIQIKEGVKMEFNFMLQIIADMDENTKEVTVKKVIPINTSVDYSEPLLHEINNTESKYGILTLGKAAKTIGMTIGTNISIEINGQIFKENVMTHKSVTGRIDGMTVAYSEKLLNKGDKIEVRYDVAKRILRINCV